MKNIILILSFLTVLLACTDKANKSNECENYVTYGKEVGFLKKYIPIIELSSTSGEGKITISAALQGRIMTSTSNGEKGRSYGWINHELFKSKDTLEHIIFFGGEERFWLGPEWGQYSIFFRKGSEFTLDNWYTPKLIDLEPFDIKKQSANSVTFTKAASLINYSGTKFQFDIQRKVDVLSKNDIQEKLKIEVPNKINTVAYKTTNSLINTGKFNWDKKKWVVVYLAFGNV